MFGAQIANELGIHIRETCRAKNASGGAIVKGDAMVADWDNDSGDATATTRLDGPNGITSNVTNVSNDTLAKATIVLVALQDLADDAVGQFMVMGVCDAFVCHMNAGAGFPFTVTKGTRLRVQSVSCDKTFDINTGSGTGGNTYAIVVEPPATAIQATGVANRVACKVFLCGMFGLGQQS